MKSIRSLRTITDYHSHRQVEALRDTVTSFLDYVVTHQNTVAIGALIMVVSTLLYFTYGNKVQDPNLATFAGLAFILAVFGTAVYLLYSIMRYMDSH